MKQLTTSEAIIIAKSYIIEKLTQLNPNGVEIEFQRCELESYFYKNYRHVTSVGRAKNIVSQMMKHGENISKIRHGVYQYIR